MRRLVAVAIDSAAVFALAYIGFRIALVAVSCKDLDSCPLLTPLVAVFAIVLVAGYFVVGQVLWRKTPGERAIDLR